MRRLFVLFFVSGFPALLYQVVWQRALFSIYGINVESVTIVVSAFMLGLGLGSLLGGWWSARPGVRRLFAFGVVEVAIGAFGWVSLAAFAAVGEATAGAGTLATGLFTFLLVLVPTIGMGATLPLLTAHLVDRSGNVGTSVGALYFVNTLGSAVACFAAGLFLLGWLGQAGAVRLAAVLNLTIGIVVLAFARGESRAAAATQDADTADGREVRGLLPLGAALGLSAAAGFVALSYEILWFRLFAFTSAGAARAFALLLGAYLAGIAFGSLVSRRFCRDERGDLLPTVGRFVVFANILGFLVAPALATSVTFVWHYALGLVFVAVAAGALGAVFPLVCHLAIPPTRRAGEGLGRLYVANIVGASLGSFLTGFVLLDRFPLPGITIGLAAAGIAGGGLLLLVGRRRRAIVVAAMALVLVIVVGPSLLDGLYERLHYKTGYDGQRYARLIETKSGVVAVTPERLVYGGGIYDGEFKVGFDDLESDTNMVWRTYMLSALHAGPEEILVIGLGSASWTRILAAHPAAPRVTVVEINPGYLDIVRGDPVVGSVLEDSRIDIVIDDARRWMLANPERRFDAIVSNTTFNWRAHITNLLSVEFLELCRSRLKPGGVAYYNTTWHPRVQRTGATVFPHAMRVGNFLAVSDAPLRPDGERLARTLRAYRIDGAAPVGTAAIEAMVALTKRVDDPALLDARHVLETGASIRARTEGMAPITDDDMGTEWDWLRIDTVDRVPHR
ncbi:MAG: fused MFS/spermidine synthase [Planctomycetota bacterium]|nr:fused MFS/spermidine synthase [Planctomycetota bacterium]